MSFVDPRELDFLLYDWLRVEELTGAEAFREHSRETFDALLDLGARLATSRFATHYKKADREEPAFDGETARILPEVKDALQAFAEAGLFAATFATELGGMQVPSVVHSAAMSHFHAANIRRALRFPRGLLTTQTHDTKRSGDVRARIAALSGMAEAWRVRSK